MATGIFDINNMRANLPLGGARPTLFQVMINNPVNPDANVPQAFRCIATHIPEMNIGTIPVYYMGRPMKNAGDRTFNSWQVTIIEDEDWVVRNSLEYWNSLINTLEGNDRDFNSSASLLYKSSATINLLSKTGQTLRTYTMEGIWPKTVGQITLGWGDTDRIINFDCTFEFDWFEPSFVGTLPKPVQTDTGS